MPLSCCTSAGSGSGLPLRAVGTPSWKVTATWEGWAWVLPGGFHQSQAFSGIAWLRPMAPEARLRHHMVLSSPPCMTSVIGMPSCFEISSSSPRVRSKSRTGTRTLSWGAKSLKTLCMRYWSLPLPLLPSMIASQPSSSALRAIFLAISWRVIEVETG